MIPSRLIPRLTLASLCLYAVLVEQGIEQAPVTLSVAQLAHALGFSPRHVRRAMGTLAPIVRVQRKGPRSIPTFTLVASHRAA